MLSATAGGKKSDVRLPQTEGSNIRGFNVAAVAALMSCCDINV